LKTLTTSATIMRGTLPHAEPAPQAKAPVTSMKPSRRIPELDGLRGLAILLVLIWHIICSNAPGIHRWLYYLMDAGSLFWSGVDLFFVLSGFLIGGILLDARSSPNYFKTFYARRVLRIIPIYSVIVGVFFICLAANVPARLAGSDWLFGQREPWYAYATFTQNIWYATGVQDIANWLRATWSLAIEEQFYLVLPALVWFVSVRKLPYVLITAILVAPLLRLFIDLHYSHGKIASFNLMPCRADALLLGVAAAMLVRQPSLWEAIKIQRRRVVSAWIVLLAGLALFTLFKATDPYQSILMSTVGLSWLALFYLGLLLLALVYSGGLLGRILRNSFLKGLGTISYGFYLLHMPVLGLTFAIFRGKGPWAQTPAERILVLVAFSVSIAIATFSWNVFEKPLVKLGHAVKY
jgi:peptidoglycan/LPS O-acetylase OafA/YrhL